jgi:VIT1/CCC1 family predicted Fe2+/Mn2+ transporter
MNAEKISRVLAILFGAATILSAIYTVATRGNAGASVVLMLITLGVLAYYRSLKKATIKPPQ